MVFEILPFITPLWEKAAKEFAIIINKKSVFFFIMMLSNYMKLVNRLFVEWFKNKHKIRQFSLRIIEINSNKHNGPSKQ